MHPAFTEDPNFLARFQREARIVAKLDHPHIVPIYDFAEHRGHPYLVMRFVEGETLKAHMRHVPLDPHEVWRLAHAVGEALTYAHGQGILHRDIKPSNVLLTPEGCVYLTDFGLARMAEAGESTLSHDMMIGTPQYISPEQAKGVTELDARTDVYSLGVVMYEMLVGQAPFTADTPYAIIHDHIFTPLPLPRPIKPDLPDRVERVLLKALAKEPDDRFQSVQELVTALDQAIGPVQQPSTPAETVTLPSAVLPPAAEATEAAETPFPEPAPEEQPAKEEEKPGKKKRRWWIAAGVAASICLITLLCLAISSRQQQRSQRVLEQARAAVEEGNPEHALELYREALDADPHLIPAYAESSELLIRMEQIDPAIEMLMAGIEANPDNPELHKRAAGITLATRRLDEARHEIEWLLAEAPEDALSHAYAGVLTLAEGNPCEAAHPQLDEALQINPELPWAHYGLAMCLLEAGNVEGARGELEFVLGHENTPPTVRRHAEELLTELEEGAPPDNQPGIRPVIREEFEALFPLVGEIANEPLRGQSIERLEQARMEWDAGNETVAVQILRETRVWMKEHWDGIGDPPAGELDRRLEHIIHLATGP
jgi:tetratricopeptide (TPR) repeat protein